MEARRKIRLGDACKTNANSYSPKEEWDFVNYLDTGNITNNRIDSIQFIDVRSEKLPSRARRKVKKDSIIYSTVRPNQRHFGIIKSQPEHFLVSTGFAVIDVDANVLDADFLYYLLTQATLVEALHAIAEQSTSAYPSIKPSDIEDLEIEIPDLATQKKIADVLGSMDRRITQNTWINNNLEQQAQAFFKSWFVDYVPFGGSAPKEWKIDVLDDITSLVSRGITPKYSDSSDQIVINQKCIRNHMIDLSLARTHIPKAINEKWLRFGDLLINSTGDGTLGRVAQIWFEPKNLTVDSHVTIARPARENLVFYIGFWGILHEKEIESLHTGSTGQTELPRDRVKAMELLLPDNETLDRFNAIIAPMTAAIVSNQKESNKLAEVRDALLPKLMSSEIDVSDIQL